MYICGSQEESQSGLPSKVHSHKSPFLWSEFGSAQGTGYQTIVDVCLVFCALGPAKFETK